MAALLLGLMMFYDEGKLLILLEAYVQSDEPQVQLRALTCAMLAMLAHGKRAASAKGVNSRIATLADVPE